MVKIIIDEQSYRLIERQSLTRSFDDRYRKILENGKIEIEVSEEVAEILGNDPDYVIQKLLGAVN